MKYLIIGGLLGMALGCGGGGGGSTTGMQGAGATSATGAAGIYTGTVVSATLGSFSAYMVLSPGGQMRYVGSNNVLAVGQLANGSASASLYMGTTGLFGTAAFTNIVITPGTSVTGQYSESGGDSGTINFQYNALYTRPQAMSALAGDYLATWNNMTDGLSSSLALGTAGSFSGSDSEGNTFTGTLTQPDPTANLYDATASYSNGYTYDGLAFFADSASGLEANSLYCQLSGTNNTLAVGGIFTGATAAVATDVPTISGLTYSPQTAVANQGNGSVTVSFSFDFTDQAGDVTTLNLYVYDATGTTLVNEMNLALDGSYANQTTGLLSGTLPVPTNQGAFTDLFAFSVTNASGSESNKLQGLFSVTAGTSQAQAATAANGLAAGKGLAGAVTLNLAGRAGR